MSLRDRGALVMRALTGTLPTNLSTVGGKLLAGVISPGGAPSPRNVRELVATYGTSPWLRAVVARIAFDVAVVQWRLYAKREKGKRAVRDGSVLRLQKSLDGTWRRSQIKTAIESDHMTQIEDHPFLDLLDKFNVFHTGLAGRKVTQQHLDLAGEAFWLIERDGLGTPIAVWPIPPSWIMGTPTPARQTFRVSFKGWQGSIDATEVVWFSDLNPSDPYHRGLGTAQSLTDDLETDEYAVKHVKALFFNRGRPDIIVSPKDLGDGGGMSLPEVERLEEGWLQRARGVWRSSKPFFLRRPVDVKTLDQDLRSNQFVQLREFERNLIIEVFGVSPEMFGITTGASSRATVGTAEYIYGKRVQVPRLELLRSVMQERLIPEFDERLILEYENPVGRDAVQELEAMKARPEAFEVDEWRVRAGEAALPNGAGKRFIVAMGIETVQDLADLEPQDPLPIDPLSGLDANGNPVPPVVPPKPGQPKPGQPKPPVKPKPAPKPADGADPDAKPDASGAPKEPK